MKNTNHLKFLLAICISALSCAASMQNDEREILSLVFNTQIGNHEHLGTAAEKRTGANIRDLKRRIIFFNKAKLNDHYKGWATTALQDHDIDLHFLSQLTDWDKSDIENDSPYEILNYDEFESGQIDSIHVGIMTFSQISMEKEKQKATIYYDWLCGSTCGYGNIVFLEKANGRWKITKVISAWNA